MRLSGEVRQWDNGEDSVAIGVSVCVSVFSTVRHVVNAVVLVPWVTPLPKDSFSCRARDPERCPAGSGGFRSDHR